MDLKEARTIILLFPEVTEEPHFEKISFRVRKKIFATFNESNNELCIKLSTQDQDAFCTIKSSNMSPVENKWGKVGWTILPLNEATRELFIDAVSHAYITIAPKKLGDILKNNLLTTLL